MRLEPCPFCGSKDIKDNYVYMSCDKCKADGPKMNDGNFDDHADYIDRERAIRAWNSRTSEVTIDKSDVGNISEIL